MVFTPYPDFLIIFNSKDVSLSQRLVSNLSLFCFLKKKKISTFFSKLRLLLECRILFTLLILVFCLALNLTHFFCLGFGSVPGFAVVGSVSALLGFKSSCVWSLKVRFFLLIS